MIKITAKTNPLDSSVVHSEIEVGASIADIIGRVTDKFYVEVDGSPVPPELWESTYPEDSSLVSIVSKPEDFVTPIVMAVMAVVEAAAGAAGLGAGAAAFGAAGTTSLALGSTVSILGISTGMTLGGMLSSVAMMGMSMISALVKPQMPSLNTGPANRYYTLTNGNNQANPYSILPRLYGSYRMNPPLAANYYTETSGDKQYLHALFCLGYGPLALPKSDGGHFFIGPKSGVVGNLPGSEAFVQLIQGNDSETTGTNKVNKIWMQDGNDLPISILDPLAIRIGDAAIGQYSDIIWQIGTADAIIKANTAEYNTNRPADKKFSRLYSTDIDEVQVDETLMSNWIPLYTKNGISGTVYMSEQSTWQGQQYYFPTSINTTAEDPVKVAVDITFPQGFYLQLSSGMGSANPIAAAIEVEVRYRVSGSSGPWLVPQNVDLPGDGDKWVNTAVPANVGGLAGNDRVWRLAFKKLGTARRGMSFTIDNSGAAPGTRYEVRLRRVGIALSNNMATISTDFAWTALRTIRSTTAWNLRDSYEDTAQNVILMAIRVRASQQLTGSLDPVTVHMQSVLPASDNGSGSDLRYEATSNPAWIYADILRGPQVSPSSRVPLDRVDWYRLKQWADWCDGVGNLDKEGNPKEFQYNWYHVDEDTMLDRLRAVSSTGRASWAIQDGKFSVIRESNYEPVQLISPRNSRNFELVKNFPKIPNALRVRYITRSSWQQAEKLILDDYYYVEREVTNPVSKAVTVQRLDAWNRNIDDPAAQAIIWPNLTAAQRLAEVAKFKMVETYETLETQGVIDQPNGTGYTATQAFREGRYYLAVMRLRPETFKVEMDIESLIAQRGDTVLLAHDAMLRGRASGRVVSINPSTGMVEVDQVIDARSEEGVSGFGLRVRLQDASVILLQVSEGTEPTTTIHCSGNLGAVSVGDLFVFGPMELETILAKVSSVDFQPDLSASITLVAAEPGILTADEGLIEDDGSTTPDVPPDLRYPPVPIFNTLDWDPATIRMTAGGPEAKVNLSWTIPSSKTPTSIVHCHYTTDEWASRDVESFIVSSSDGTAQLSKSIRIGEILTAYLKSESPAGLQSEATDTKTLQVGNGAEVIPADPTNLSLVATNYVTSDGVVHYEIAVSWLQPEPVGGTEVQYQATSVEDPEQWQGSFVPSGSNYVIKGIQPDEYRVRVRSKSLLSSDYSGWLLGTILVEVRDYNPNPPTNLTAQSVANGVNLSWVNPLDPDLGSIQIYESLLNNRASATKIADLFANTYFRPISDLANRYYWIRAVDRRGNLSTWEPLDALAGVTGKALGIIGDGLPPPAPTGLTVTTKTWQATLEWTQGGEIADLVGTEIWYSTTNNRENATRVSLVRESFYTQLNLDTDTTYYYWIRNKDVEDFYSGWFPESASEGVSATVPKDPSDYIQLLDDLVFLVVPNNLTVNGVQGSYVNVKDDVVVTGDQSQNSDCVFFPAGVYIRNAMIADGSLEGVKIKAESIMSDRIDTRNLTLRDADGNIILGGGVNLDVTAIDGMGLFATLNKLDAENIDLYISSGAIGNAYIGNIIKSANYVAGISGWQLNKEGSIEVMNLNARGTIQSTTFIPGLQGWRIDENGAVEFNSGVFRGMLSASSLIVGVDNIPSPFTLADVIDGTAINRLDLQQSGLFFSFNQLGQVQGASSIIFTAVGNNADYAHWECIPYSASGTAGTAITLGGQGDTRVLTAAQFGNADYADVRIWFGDLEDRTRIGRLTDGGTGLVGYLTNETQPLPVDGNGNIFSYSLAVGEFKVSYGTQDVTNLCSFSVTLRENIPVNKALISPDGTYSVTETTAEVASATFRATYNDVYIEKKFKVYKTAQSAPGPAGVVIDLSQDSHTVPTESNGSNGDYSGASTTANIYEGGSQTSSLWSWVEPTTANSGLTGGISGVWSASTRTFTVTNMTQDAGTVVFRASRAGYSDQTAIFNLSKSKGGEAYYLVVESSNGIIFRPGQGKTTILKARLFSNGEEITDTVSASWFKWTRVSSVPQSPPNDDATWNTAHSAGYKQVEISVDDVYARATFFCDIVSP